MFIISIDGGLGNQMFEYAFLLSMRKKFPDSDFFIDLSMMKPDTHNGYELARIFGIEEPHADLKNVAELSEYCPAQVRNSVMINQINRLRRIVKGRKQSYLVQEDSSEFYNQYYELDPEKSYYLRGVWANRKYFEDIKDTIINIFSFPEIQDKGNQALMKKILQTDSVSVHFRKGDYVKFGFEVLGETFYKKAMEYVNKMVSDPQYFIFSDDISAAKDVLGERVNYTFVNGNSGMKAYMDMQLMSLCKHNIVANSTFSFWGAYLNRNSDKIVIYPEKPLRGCRHVTADCDWIGLEF